MDIAKLNALITLANLQVTKITAIPNEYDSDSVFYGPWYLLDIPWIGQVKLGWRKRVMVIDWSNTNRELYNDGKKTHPFTEDDVTQSLTDVHAHGYGKAIEYLERLKQLPYKKEFSLTPGRPMVNDHMRSLSTQYFDNVEAVFDMMFTEGSFENPDSVKTTLQQLKQQNLLDKHCAIYQDEAPNHQVYFLVTREGYTWFRMKEYR